MNHILRVLRAFILAVKMTLRGEKPIPVALPPIVLWSRQLVERVDAVSRAADAHGLDKTARQKLALRLDGRMRNVEFVLATIRFHAAEEYPSLFQNGLTSRHLNAVYATNMNDQYWVSRLLEVDALQSPLLRTALDQLRLHLESVPPPASN
jgi:hypothetical protein